MFIINADKSIYLTRGDTAVINVSAIDSNNEPYMFETDNKIRFKVFEKSRCDNIVMVKTVTVNTECSSVSIVLSSEDTKIGDVINKPKDYWYEVELNPETLPQTIIGYDENGPKVFRLFPEGDDK